MAFKLAKIKFGMISGPFFLLILAVSFAWASNDELYSLVRLFDKIAVTVSDRYVDDIDPEKLINAGIEAITEKLDPYSRYLYDQDYFYLIQETSGEYSGIGIEIENHSDTLLICSVLKGTPASQANIRIGDRILEVDHIDAIGKSPPDGRKLLRGENGSMVSLKLWRPLLQKSLDLKLPREEIHIEPIPYWGIDNNNNGYIKIARFSEGSLFEVKSFIFLLQAEGIDGLIIDLRDNPGGLLHESVEIAGLFLNKGDKIVETRGRGAASLRTYEARENGVYNEGPLTLIINSQTASAAEIVAGAIQDNDRGLLIGSTSYGKGLVQQILQFSDNSALKLTTAKYYTPSERCIQKDRMKNELRSDSESEQKVIYYTKSGRPVFGGGGIIPDIYVESWENEPVIDEIITAGYISDFVEASSARLKIDNNFSVSDELVDQLFKYIQGRDYTYHNPIYNSFDLFLSQNIEQSEETSLNDHFDAIVKILEQNSKNEMLSMRSRFKDILYEFYIRTNLGEKKAFELVYQKKDPELIKAGKVLKNPETYSSLLVGF
ncbi:MAG: S41 family peptidase [candidate division Zixibacteria bacterium]|nr:S41 family peptidase [candidate division Zixibacteria bacterium]